MSWEIISRRDYPCSCGKGTYTEVNEMDDWNRSRVHRTMHCTECARKEAITEIEITKERALLKKLDVEITTYFVKHYMQEWRTYFSATNNKKQTWELAKELGIEKDSLSAFYNRRKNLSMDEYIGELAKYYHLIEIMNVLNIEDSDLKSKVQKANALHKAEYSRMINEAYNNN